MHTLEEILNMPYNENRLFAMYHGETYEEFCSLVYTDEDGILRYEIDDNSKEENGKVYGNVVPIHNETLNYKFQVVYKFIPFIEAFNQWYFNNKIIWVYFIISNNYSIIYTSFVSYTKNFL